MNKETYQPLSLAVEGKNLIPLVPPGIKNNKERLQDGMIIADYGTNPDGSPFLRISRDPKNSDQNPKVYLEPDTASLHYIVKGEAETVQVFGSADLSRTPKRVTLEAAVTNLETFNKVFVKVEKAHTIYASGGSYVEVMGDVDKAAAQFDAAIHSHGVIYEEHHDTDGVISTDV